jgi:hypothetical protein
MKTLAEALLRNRFDSSCYTTGTELPPLFLGVGRYRDSWTRHYRNSFSGFWERDAYFASFNRISPKRKSIN